MSIFFEETVIDLPSVGGEQTNITTLMINCTELFMFNAYNTLEISEQPINLN